MGSLIAPLRKWHTTSSYMVHGLVVVITGARSVMARALDSNGASRGFVLGRRGGGAVVSFFSFSLLLSPPHFPLLPPYFLPFVK